MNLTTPFIETPDATFAVLFTAEQIQNRLKALAQEISLFYQNKAFVMLGILNGAYRFIADLSSYLPTDAQVSVDFLKVSSYEGMTSHGIHKFDFSLKQSLSQKHVLIVEDVIDTGKSMVHILEQVQAQQPASVEMATLLFKPTALQVVLTPLFVGFEISPAFVIGYGLDYDEKYRHLNDIYTKV